MAFKKDNKVKSNFSKITIGLASPEEILENSFGEVTKPETINYRTYKPERDGLFCERIFGPTKDYECACGKYKRIRYKGIVCDRCGVEVTEKKVRRERAGHIELVVPVAHIWYFRSLPNKIGYLLGMPTKKLDAVIYYEKYVVIQPGVVEGMKNADTDEDLNGSHKFDLLSEDEYLDILDNKLPEGNERLDDSDPSKFIAKMGAEAVYDLLTGIDLDRLAGELRDRATTDSSQQRKTDALKRLQVVEGFRQSIGVNRPEWMIMKIIPVTPPELRPLVPLDGGRFATSDLNDLYRRVIIRNNRLKRLMEIKAPEVILRNEKRMLQEAVDSLFDNSRKSSAVKSESNRPLKSLSDSLKGKQGRFRQNLLGKRVDYSARSVIVVGPELKMGECGLPKLMAAELYKPFIIRKLIERGIVKTVKSAKKIVDRREPVIWDILENVMKGHPVMLNRAPTLHRLGIQAFQPKLIEGKAIQLHPLVCAPFNADFDGDQMAVHLPLGAEAQSEARILMLSANNILKPSDGRPVTMPAQEMIAGLFHLTSNPDPAVEVEKDANGEPVVPAFSSFAEAKMAFDFGKLHLNALADIRFEEGITPPIGWVAPENYTEGDPITLRTTLGRAIFNINLPGTFPYVNEIVDKKKLSDIINTLAERYPRVEVAASLDALKNSGFGWATWSGVTVAFSDVVSPASKPQILAGYEAQAAKIEEDFAEGMLTEDDRYDALIKIWTEATNEVAQAMRDNFPERNTVYRMVSSGSRGNWDQIRQLAGMRGLVSDPKQRLIERPITSNYREGLSVLEYFTATHGARKGLADTALRTADSGYLTRRLVDVAQDVIVREEDCGTRKGLTVQIADRDAAGNLVPGEIVETTAYARTLARDAVDAEGNVVLAAGEDVGDVAIEKLVAAGIESIVIRSVLTCDSAVGTCAACYGRSLATGKRVDIGEAVGIIAAQSIGEPGTQLTMRTFHTGGAATSADITQGLPRVQELFEARTPKGEAVVAEAAGRLAIEDDVDGKRLVIKRDDAEEDLVVPVSRRAKLLVKEGDHVDPGQPMTEGPIDPKKVLRLRSVSATQRHLVDEVQKVYRDQGVDIHAKHIEVIVRQMLRRVTVLDPGDTDLLQGDFVDVMTFREQSRKAMAEGGKPASGRTELMGITKASLATDSWLSAASFQETTRVLTEAAMNGRSDTLMGLKENVILGKLIPAGTGLARYHDVEVEPTETAKAEIFSRTGDTQVTNNYGLGDFHADFSDDYHTGFSSSVDYQF